MSAGKQKIVLSASRDIPFNKLVLSQANVRRVKAGMSIEELAADIARRTLLQSPSVRPVLDAEGNETGTFEVPAGGRRYRALELLVRQKRMAKTQAVPCIATSKVCSTSSPHVMCLNAFYLNATDSCLEIVARSASFGTLVRGLNDTASAKAIEGRHEAFAVTLPREPRDLWDALIALDWDSRAALFAHCAALTVNAVHDPANRRRGAIAHADRLAQTVNLDMTAAGWSATADSFFARVTKGRILETVREAKGEAATQLIDHLKKLDMARQAERLLDGTCWLPEPLRTPEFLTPTSADAKDRLPAFLTRGRDDQPPKPDAIAAE
jgi:hypothetical protein